LATSGLDYKVKLWDIETGAEKFNVDHHAGIIQSVEFNNDGSTIATSCKDKKLRVIDPRSNTVAGEVEAHAGVKGGRCTWLGDKDKIFTVGFSKTSERCMSVWDPKSLKEPLKTESIDQAAGIIMPFYDNGSSVLFLAGKGDGSIKYFEIVEDNKIIHFLSQYGSTTPQQGMAAMPKRGCNVSTNEIMRLYKAMATVIEPISFTVPRKSDVFQEDLFPDAPSNEPALSASEWVSGANKAPKLRSLAPGFVEKPQAASSFTKAEAPAAKVSSDDLAAENEKLKKRVAFLEAELVKKDAALKDLQK
jgi:coronin-1B/1C/6